MPSLSGLMTQPSEIISGVKKTFVALAAVLSLFATAACGTSNDDVAAPTESVAASADSDAQPDSAEHDHDHAEHADSSATDSRNAADTVPLYEALSGTEAAGATGQKVEVTVGGKKQEATGIWVGCDGDPATATYDLDGAYTALTGKLALADHTPVGVHVQVEIRVDGKTVASERLVPGTSPQSVDVDVTGATSLVVSAEAVQGQCSTASAPYGTFLDAELTES